MPDARAFLTAAVDYLRKNPDEIFSTAVNAASLKFGVPLVALRWFSSQANLPRKAPKDIDIDSAPPALRVGLSVQAMGTPIRATGNVRVDEIDFSSDAMRIGIRLSDVKLALLAESDTALATLIKSGALDLTKTGNLLKFVPNRPEAIIDAEDDRIVVDLLKIPSIAKNYWLRRALAVVTPVVGVRAVETDRDHLYIAFKASPRGLPKALAALRGRS